MGQTDVRLYTAGEVLIAVGCVLCNAVAIGAVWTTKSLREPTFCFLASLAAADLLVGLLAIPLAVVVDGRVETSAQVCLFSSCLLILPTLASILSLLAIAVDRFLRVQVPIRYRRSVTETQSWLVVAVCWAAATVLSFTPLFGWNNQSLFPPEARYPNASASASASPAGTMVCSFVSVMSLSYLVYFCFFLCNLLPLSIMALLYGCIFLTIRRSLRAMPGRAGRCESQGYLRKERRLAASLCLVLGLFALSWLPLHSMNAAGYFGGAQVPLAAIYAGILLSHANSAVNPVLYAFRIPKVKHAYQRMWSRVTGCGRESGSSQPPSSQSDNMGSSNYVDNGL